MTHQAKAISYEARAKVFWTLILIVVITLGLYIYSVSTTIRNTAARQILETKVSHLNADLGLLEFAYIEKRNEVSLELAYEYGFIEARNPIYVSRTPGSALTMNTSH
jgi:hypothetical protein